jgi:glycosyltransferase involved in cell wall biosynthesis
MSRTLENPARSPSDEWPGDRPVDRTEKPQRIAIVCRRAWPLAGDEENGVLTLAGELSELGMKPTLVTARWQANWAERTTLGSVPVVRLPMPTTPGWQMLRYLYAFNRYLRQNRDAFDAVVICGLKAEAYCAIPTLQGSHTRVILRASEAGPHGDVAWQRRTRFGNRIATRCKEAEVFLASSTFVADELSAAGYPRERIHVGGPVVRGSSVPRNEDTRQAARTALAGVNHDLHVVGGAPVALCISPLQQDRGLETLIRAWLPIQQRWPHARLWIIGDGPEREPLFQLLCNLDLRYRVVLPGAFDHWDDLMLAADVLVAPAPQPGNSLVLQHAVASGLPVVACDQAEHRGFITSQRNGLLYAASERSSLSQGLSRLLDDADLRKQLADAALELHQNQPKNDESLWLRNYLAAQRLS